MLKKDIDLIKRIPTPEVDIDTLKNILREYSRPYEKIRSWVGQGVLIRMTRGWYVLGQEFRSRPWSREYTANVLYTPSYISLDYALSYYGFIPERVQTVTSITTGKTRIIDTPLGRFSYRKVPEKVFQMGIDLHTPEHGPSFFIATPEKTLADKVNQFFTMEDIRQTGLNQLLFNNLRIEPEKILTLDYKELENITYIYRSRKVSALNEFVNNLHKKRRS